MPIRMNVSDRDPIHGLRYSSMSNRYLVAALVQQFRYAAADEAGTTKNQSFHHTSMPQ